ncbi:MAG: hypothetical protein ABI439_08285 [Rhodospirillales bacterium]
MKAAIKAGIFYFILVFAAAFVLGAIRIRLIVPNLGEIVGLLVELPVILVWAWLVCGWLVRRARVPARSPIRIFMGVLALILLIVAETLIGILGLRETVLEHFAAYSHPVMLIGLAAQIAFAAMPWLRMKYVLPRRFE